MAEPSTTTLTTATMATISLASLLPGIDGNALIGAFAGATLFVMSAKELTVFMRLTYLLISIVMGYLAAPEITAKTFITETGVAGFIAGLLCVTGGLLLIKKLEDLDLIGVLKGLRK